jgi:hypothetical protein
VKTCDRCQQPIRAGEAYDTIIPESMSAARPTDYRHQGGCWTEPPVMLTPENPRPRPRPRR